MGVLPAFVLPSSTLALKQKLHAEIVGIDADIASCAGFAGSTAGEAAAGVTQLGKVTAAELSSWGEFKGSFQAWYEADESFFAAGSDYDRGLQYEKTAADWQSHFAAKCAMSSPSIHPEADAASESAQSLRNVTVAVVAVSAAVVAWQFLKDVPIVVEAFGHGR